MAEDNRVDALFVGEFDDFVARRNALAKEMRASGDRAGGEGVRALKKPSRVAWAINQVSARRSKLRDELLDAGAALRETQAELVSGSAERAALREAGEREQAAVSRALDAVTSLAGKAGAKLSPPATDQARQTLHAVALDEDVRRDFEAHRLTTDHEAASLGGLALGGAAPAPKGRGKAGGKAAKAKDAERREEKRRRDALKAAEAKARKLEEKRQDAEREVRAAREDTQKAERKLERAIKELDRATRDADAAADGDDALRT